MAGWRRAGALHQLLSEAKVEFLDGQGRFGALFSVLMGALLFVFFGLGFVAGRTSPCVENARKSEPYVRTGAQSPAPETPARRGGVQLGAGAAQVSRTSGGDPAGTCEAGRCVSGFQDPAASGTNFPSGVGCSKSRGGNSDRTARKRRLSGDGRPRSQRQHLSCTRRPGERHSGTGQDEERPRAGRLEVDRQEVLTRVVHQTECLKYITLKGC